MPYRPKVITTNVQSSNLPHPNFKEIVNSVLMFSLFKYVHFKRVGDLKTQFLYIDHFAKPNNIVNITVL